MFQILKTFYHFAAQKKLAFAGFIVLVIVTTILGDLTPYFYKLFIDEIPNNNYQKLIWILVIYTGVRIVRLIFNILTNVAGDFNVIDAAANLRSKVFKQVQDLDFVFHSNKSTGSLISIFKRGDSAFFNIFDVLHHRILETVTGMIIMFYFFSTVDIKLTVAAIISMILTSLAAKFLLQTNLAKRIEFNNQEDNISSVITDNMINYETVKLFAKENYEQNRLETKFTDWKKALWDFANSFRVVDLTIGSIINLGVFAILFFSLQAAASGKINIGDFVLVTAFINNFIPRLWDLTWSFKDISKNYADIEKYFGLLDYEIEVKDPEHPIKIDDVAGEINFNDISFAYKERAKNTIKEISLKIKKGESVALVGRSGSGKTTLVKLLMRFFDLSSGHILIDGIDIRDFTKSDLRSFIGVVPQEPILFNNTIAYNIGYGKDKPNFSDIKSAAKLANIDDFIQSLPKKYETEVGERGVKLSGGQKQRLAIARMILSNPDIVIFDEATSHLDSESEKLIQDAFWRARKNKTTIIIAHRLSTIMRADKIVVMEHGRIKEIGTHEELLKNKESLYSHFWNLQIKLD
ncbi:MAG TPA: ABC transporter ATP-binding protein [Alphaproteobacteria bacterium]|jgi:ATP-binding cassette subfamily B protein|nr:ABC transporter ATP-binding protein [Alphaproteobacteria bacterium]